MKLVSDTKIRIKWFVYDGDTKIPHNATMRGNWGWDAQCSCGWETKTGGATYPSVKKDVDAHKRLEHNYTYEVSA